MMPRLLLVLGALALAACSGSSSPAAGGRDDAARTGGPADVTVDGTDDADATDTDDSADEGDAAEDADALRVDTIVEDGFTRPPLDTTPSDPAVDAPPGDTAEVDDDSGPELPDASEDPGGDPGASDTMDAADIRDVGVGELWRVGTSDCLRWEILAESLIFDFKEEDFLVSYNVTNVCAAPLSFRVRHFNDFFPMAVHQDGELWTYLGLCPGEGPEHEWTFRTTEAVRRAFPWSAADHESLLSRCGSVPFDPEASHTLVGYGLTELGLDGTGYSDVIRLTDEIPIVITD